MAKRKLENNKHEGAGLKKRQPRDFKTNSDQDQNPEFLQNMNPSEVLDADDPGDETQRRFRYQHAYGVILLTGMFLRGLPYKTLWCEHHDDYLAQLNGKFDSFQIKTRKPELGYWELNSEGFVSAISKFATLDIKFPEVIRKFHFVSNSRIADSKAKAKIGRSPIHLKEAVLSAGAVGSLKSPFSQSLTTLASNTCSTPDHIFKIFERLEFVIGPSLDDFEAVLSHMHISRLPSCSAYTPHQLNAVRDELIQKIFDASSNFVDDTAKHWSCLNGSDALNPQLRAKQLYPDVVEEAIRSKSPPYFRYSPISTKTDVRLTANNLTTLEKKFLRGDLRQQMETMRRRTISTEQHLLEIAASRPDAIVAIRNQLESIVQDICNDAALQTQANGQVSGQAMLAQVQRRLQKIAEEQPNNVYNQPYECLVGMAGLLTEECTVWWSDQFDLNEATI